MDPNAGKKKAAPKKAKAKKGAEKIPKAGTSDESSSELAGAETDFKDDELPSEHLKGLDEALKAGDVGEPITLKEFQKMLKKWGS